MPGCPFGSVIIVPREYEDRRSSYPSLGCFVEGRLPCGRKALDPKICRAAPGFDNGILVVLSLYKSGH